jgi:heme/copper-type cytochrome/quinol oxidase subunit 2
MIQKLLAIPVAKAAGIGADTGILNGSDPNAAAGEFLNHIVDILLMLAIPLAIIAVAFAAYSLIRSQGKPEGYANAKKYLIYVVIGIFLIVFAGILVRTVYSLFAAV